MSHRPFSHYSAGWQTATEIYANRVRYVPALGEYASSLHQWNIGLTLAGYCRYRLDNREIIVERGDLTIIQPHCWQSLRTCDERPATAMEENRDAGGYWDTVYAVFHPYPHWQPWLDDLDFRDGVCLMRLHDKALGDITTALLRVADTYQAGGLFRDDEALNALEAALIVIRRHAPSVRVGPDQRIRRAIDFITQRFGEPLSVEDIATSVGLSANRLSKIFVNATGMGPSQYLERVRLSRAAEMLRFGNSTVAEVAQSTGYSDAFYFTRRFKLHYGGQSPRAYRKSMRSRQAAEQP